MRFFRRPALLCLLLTGCHWLYHYPIEQIKTYSSPDHATLPAVLVFDDTVEPDEQKVIQRAAAYLHQVLGIDAFEVSPYSVSDGTMVLVEVKEARPSDPASRLEELAVSQLSPLTDGTVPFAHVTFFSAWLFNESDADMETTARHELMHVLGLNHTEDRSCIMYSVILPMDAPRPACPDELQKLKEIYRIHAAPESRP